MTSPAAAHRRVVIVGAGLAGARTASELRRLGYEGQITLVGDEPHLPYDRPPLSKQVLAGDWPPGQATLCPAGDYADNGIDLLRGTPAAGLDAASVCLADGSRLPYDALVLATGMRARRLPGQPHGPRVHTLRTLDDCRELRAALAAARSLTIIGGGFIGGEVASVARARGLEVTMVESLDLPLQRVLGPRFATHCARLHLDHGVRLRCGTTVERFLDVKRSAAIRLADGTSVDADLAVVCTGARPNSELLHGSRTGQPGQPLPCDARGRVAGARNVYAAGDVAAWDSPLFGSRVHTEHWTSASEQAAVVAGDITGRAGTARPIVPYFWSDQHHAKIQLIGRPQVGGPDEELYCSPDGSSRVFAYFSDDRLVAAAALNAPRLLGHLRRLLLDQADRATVLDRIADRLAA